MSFPPMARAIMSSVDGPRVRNRCDICNSCCCCCFCCAVSSMVLFLGRSATEAGSFRKRVSPTKIRVSHFPFCGSRILFALAFVFVLFGLLLFFPFPFDCSVAISFAVAFSLECRTKKIPFRMLFFALLIVGKRSGQQLRTAIGNVTES